MLTRFNAARKAWRSDPLLHAVALLFIFIAATRIFYVVLHDPMLGYGNQYDMGRTAACLSLWPNLPGGPRDVANFAAPIAKHQQLKIPSQRCYPSAEALLDHVAVSADGMRRYWTGDVQVDLRAIGTLKALLLLAAACLAQQALGAYPRAALLHAATFVAVMADPILTLYLNTLYGEFVAALGAYAAIAGLAVMVVHRRWTASTLALFVAGNALLAFSRVQHLLLPLFFVALLAALTRHETPLRRWLRERRVTCAVIGLLTLVSAASIMVNVTFLRATPIFHDVNRNDMLFDAVLPATAAPREMVASLGLPPACSALLHSDFYRKALRGQSGACPQALALPLYRVLGVLASEPTAMVTLLARGILLASGWRVPYVGEVADGSFQRAASGPLWLLASANSISQAMTFTAHAIFWVVPMIVGLCAGLGLMLHPPRSRSIRPVSAILVIFFSLSAVIGSAWVTSLLGDGFSELARHVHLGVMAALASWALLVGCLLTERFPLAALLRTRWWWFAALILTVASVCALLSRPVAYGRLTDPADDAALASSARFSGYVIAPEPIVAVEIGQQGRALLRVSVTPATTWARYHPMNGGGNAFDFAFDRAAMMATFAPGVPITVVAIRANNERQLVDVRHWCVAGLECQ